MKKVSPSFSYHQLPLFLFCFEVHSLCLLCLHGVYQETTVFAFMQMCISFFYADLFISTTRHTAFPIVFPFYTSYIGLHQVRILGKKKTTTQQQTVECNNLGYLKCSFKLTWKKTVTFVISWYDLHKVLSLSLSTVYVPSSCKNNSQLFHTAFHLQLHKKQSLIFNISLCTDGEEKRGQQK